MKKALLITLSLFGMVNAAGGAGHPLDVNAMRDLRESQSAVAVAELERELPALTDADRVGLETFFDAIQAKLIRYGMTPEACAVLRVGWRARFERSWRMYKTESPAYFAVTKQRILTHLEILLDIFFNGYPAVEPVSFHVGKKYRSFKQLADLLSAHLLFNDAMLGAIVTLFPGMPTLVDEETGCPHVDIFKSVADGKSRDAFIQEDLLFDVWGQYADLPQGSEMVYILPAIVASSAWYKRTINPAFVYNAQ